MRAAEQASCRVALLLCRDVAGRARPRVEAGSEPPGARRVARRAAPSRPRDLRRRQAPSLWNLSRGLTTRRGRSRSPSGHLVVVDEPAASAPPALARIAGGRPALRRAVDWRRRAPRARLIARAGARPSAVCLARRDAVVSLERMDVAVLHAVVALNGSGTPASNDPVCMGFQGRDRRVSFYVALRRFADHQPAGP